MVRVLVTGADGFIGRNLSARLAERRDISVAAFTRSTDPAALADLTAGADVVFHLAGANRPPTGERFDVDNRQLTATLAEALVANKQRHGSCPVVVYTSSIQANGVSPYAASKRAAEDILRETSTAHGIPVLIYRLPNVFGKWCRPNYNSVVATFCHNIARGLPVQIHDVNAKVSLVYIDDVVDVFLSVLDGSSVPVAADGFATVSPIYASTVGAIAEHLRGFDASRTSLITERVGTGLLRALYATYVSYLPPEQFLYEVPVHRDARGGFIEMLKTTDSGQFSYFSAHPGVTRGGHYHHTKTEKFLVIKGHARFRFRHIQTGETLEIQTQADKPQIVESVPGWTHDITNIGSEEMLVMLWANELFDRAKPDTYHCPV